VVSCQLNSCGDSRPRLSGRAKLDLLLAGGGRGDRLPRFIRENKDIMSLLAFLQSGGYRQIPLTRNAVGHFETAGTLAGRPVRVLIDTGAGSTVVSLVLC
jgi:hypothetical protein